MDVHANDKDDLLTISTETNLLSHEVTRSTLERRIHFKRLKTTFPHDSEECAKVDSILEANPRLSFWYIGLLLGSLCKWNSVRNAEAKDALIREKDFALDRGFGVVRGHTDGLKENC